MVFSWFSGGSRGVWVIVYYFNISFQKYCRRIRMTHLQCIRNTPFKQRVRLITVVKKFLPSSHRVRLSVLFLLVRGVWSYGVWWSPDEQVKVFPYVSLFCCLEIIVDPWCLQNVYFDPWASDFVCIIVFFNIVFDLLQLCLLVETDYICWISI